MSLREGPPPKKKSLPWCTRLAFPRFLHFNQHPKKWGGLAKGGFYILSLWFREVCVGRARVGHSQ